jgi:hypothetical protein
VAKIQAPRCPVHVGARMVLHKRSVPFVLAAAHNDPEYKIPKNKKGFTEVPGSFFRCPFRNCTRVAQVPNEFENAA